MDENVKRYILYGVIAVLTILLLFFVFAGKKPVKKTKKTDNLQTALKVTGVIEGFNTDITPTVISTSPRERSFDMMTPVATSSSSSRERDSNVQEQKRCDAVLRILFGKDADGGLDSIYENVMGKKMPMERITCNGKTPDAIRAYIRKIPDLIDEMTNMALKNSDLKKRAKDLVSMWIILQYGIASAMSPDQSKLTVQGDPIDSIEFKAFNPDAPVGKREISFSPAFIIAMADAYSSNSSKTNATKNLAIPLVNQAEISELRTNTNPKMTVDQLAACIIYKISKTGDMSILR